MKNCALLACCLILAGAKLSAQMPSKKEAEVSINKLINDFNTGIIKKDSTLLKSLFFDKTTPIIGVMSEPTEMSIKKNNPQFQGISVSNSHRFIKGICEAKTSQLEKFAKVKMNISENLANVQFDYAFYADGKAIQWGREEWALVFAESQWLITGINYTIRFPAVEKIPSSLENSR